MKPRKHSLLWIPLAAALVLAGCATPVAFTPDASAPVPMIHPVAARWTDLGDPGLVAQIEASLSGNLDVAQAAERLRRSRALAVAQAASRWPAADLTASAVERDDRQRTGSASLGLDLAWEIDLFGRIGSRTAAQEWRSAAAQADAQAVRRAVAAEVAHAWYARESALERLELLNSLIGNRSATLRLVEQRSRAGLATPLDVARARSDLAAIEAEAPALLAQMAVASNRLSVLSGQQPDPAQHPVRATPLPDPRAFALALPEQAAWMKSRPDIAAAEARLRALAMDVEAVRAEFLPRVSVGGFVGWLAGSAAGLSTAGTGAWVFAPSVSLPVFRAGALQARLDAARSEEREALLAYRQQVLRAAEEIENARSRVNFGLARLNSLQERARESVRAESLAQRRYAAGASDLLELLDAQRTAQQAQLGLAEALGDHRQNVTWLLRALGAI